jgi:hypothetical protein
MSILKIEHNYGFFSCASVRLCYIINHFSKNRALPDEIDGTGLFDMYKVHRGTDITYDFFKHYKDISDQIVYEREIPIDKWNFQFTSYKAVDYPRILPFVKKYFTPSADIIGICDMLMMKYGIMPDNCIGVYYRGTDKHHETAIGGFDTYYAKICELREKEKDAQIIIQTDTAPFVDYIRQKNMVNIIIISENSVSYTNRGIHYEKSAAQNYEDIKILFATLLIIARCKHIICSSGNCSIWMMYFRGGAHNVHQFLHHRWL